MLYPSPDRPLNHGNPVLDDPRSKNYPAPAPTGKPVSKVWPTHALLRQGDFECNPAALGNWLMCEPQNRTGITMEYAREQWFKPIAQPGHGVPLVKVMDLAKKNGDIAGYTWADPTIQALKQQLQLRPVLVSTNFYSDMYARGSEGLIQITGKFIAQHTWLCIALNQEKKRFGFVSSWGDANPYKITFADMAILLSRDGQICVPALK